MKQLSCYHKPFLKKNLIVNLFNINFSENYISDRISSWSKTEKIKWKKLSLNKTLYGIGWEKLWNTYILFSHSYLSIYCILEWLILNFEWK